MAQAKGQPLSVIVQDKQRIHVLCQFRCDNSAETTAWVEALAKYKKECADPAAKEEIVDSIPLHEILSVGKMSPTFFQEHANLTVQRSLSSPCSNRSNDISHFSQEISSNKNVGFAEEAALNFQLEHDQHAFYVRTRTDGFNAGHVFCFKLPSDAENASWIQAVSDRSKAALRDYIFRRLSFTLFVFSSPWSLVPLRVHLRLGSADDSQIWQLHSNTACAVLLAGIGFPSCKKLGEI